MDQKLEKTTYINMLLDFYKDLLTTKQRQYLELYYQEDLTLAEISEQFDVSRTAIFDNINRTIKTLEKYEQHLRLVQKYNNRGYINVDWDENGKTFQQSVKHMIQNEGVKQQDSNWVGELQYRGNYDASGVIFI